MDFQEVDFRQLQFNPMTMVAKEWMLLTAGGAEEDYNTMTVSWGHFGSLWGHGGGMPTAIVYVRPQRFTKQFIDRETHFTLSVFPEEYKKALGYLGSHSGRAGDKVKAAGLTPVFFDGVTSFREARLVFVCKKLYAAPLKETGFLYPELIEENYPARDFHTMYVGEIVKAYQK